MAYGGRLQHLLNHQLLQGFNAGGYWAQAGDKDLSPVLFTSNGWNCGGFAAGLNCINYRHIVGGISKGLDAGAEFLLSPATLVKTNLYYDQVHYPTRFTTVSDEDRNGVGVGVRLDHLISERFKVLGEASVREIYDTYQAGFSFLPSWGRNTELSLVGQRVVSHNATPNNNSITLSVSLFGDGVKHYENHHHSDSAFNDITQWVRTSAVKMNQVLAIAEQITRLVAPGISGISPNTGPGAGGNTVIISGTNFVQGLLVFFGGQLATQIEVLSATSVSVVVPALADPANGVVDVAVQNPDGQKTVVTDGYNYIVNAAPVITLQPENQTVVVGSSASFTAAATGNPTPTVQWQSSTDSGTNWMDVVGAITTTYTIPNATTSDSGTQYRAIFTNSLGQAITNAALLTVTPQAPVITGVNSTTGPIPDGGFTNDPRPTINGTAEANLSITIYANGQLLTTTPADALGNWTYTPPTSLTDDRYEITATATSAGGTSPSSNTFTFTVQTVAPPVPTITEVISDVQYHPGPIANNGSTNDSQPIIKGTATPTSTITIYDGGLILGTADTNSSGVWEFTPSVAFAEGQHIITATAKDQVGNTSPHSDTFPFTVDTTQPAVPILNVTSHFLPTGLLNSGDTTKDPMPTFSGTAEVGGTVNIYNDGNVIGTADVDSSGIWSFTPSTALNDGLQKITTDVTDPAGNRSAQTNPSFDFTVNTTPDVPTNIQVIDNVGPVQGSISPGDTTDDSTPTIQGTAEPNVTIKVYDNGGSLPLGEITADASGNWVFIPTTPLADGNHSITVTASTAYATSAASVPFPFIVDTTTPAAPTIESVASDVPYHAGPIPDGGFTNDTKPTFSGSTAPNTQTVTVYDGGAAIGMATIDSSGNWVFTPTSDLAEGQHTITVTATNKAGVISDLSGAFELNVDTMPPAVPSLNVTSHFLPTGLLNNGDTTKDPMPTFSGTAEAGGSVNIYNDGTVLGTAPVDSSGNWNFTLLTPLSDGEQNIAADVTDIAGNRSAQTNPVFDFIVDTAPTITEVYDDTGPVQGAIAPGDTTDDTLPTFTGIAAPGATINLYDNGGSTPIAQATADAQGNWMVNPFTPLSNGSHTITATATSNGITSPASTGFQFNVQV